MEHPLAARPLRYKGYIPGLDVLRGVAILMVLLYHGTDARVPWETSASWTRWPLLAMQYGSSGVQLFFILSGFLITSILIDTVASQDYYRKFYLRRALRILPAYLLMLVILKFGHVISLKFVLAALLYIANMASMVGAKSNEYGSLWSLAVEEQFYLIWPIIVRRFSLLTLTRFTVGYLVFDVILRLVYLVYLPHSDIRYKLWFNAEMLLAGALISILLRRELLRRDNIDRLIRISGALAVLTWPLDIWLDVYPPSSTWTRSLLAFYHFPFMLTFLACLLLVIKHNQGLVPGSRPNATARTLTFFGYVSYGLYLVHQLVFRIYDRLVQGTIFGDYSTRTWSLLLSTLICIAVATALAYLSRRYFEDFFLRRKDKIVPYKNPAVNEAPVTESL